MKFLLRIHGGDYANRLFSFWLQSLAIIGIFLWSSQKANAQTCSVAIRKVTVSGCYLVNGQSKATVSVEVEWSNAPSGGVITVTTGSQSRTITPGSITVDYPQVTGVISSTQVIVSPQVVAFEVDANGATNQAVTARFNATCTDSDSYNVPASCAITACNGSNLGGIVFKDFNDNGIKEAGETAGVSSVLVKGIACDGTVYTGTTDGYGYYSLPVPANKYPVRVEFTSVPSVYKLGINGANSRTSVQFVGAPSCNVNLGVINPIDYCSDNNLRLFVPCFVYGDPLPTTGATSADLSGNADAFVSIPYGVTAGIGTTNPLYFDERVVAKAKDVGTVWGLAYNKYTKRMFMSAVLKRHAGLGPQGLGGIYVTNYSNPASPVVTPFLNVTTDLGINIGSVASNSTRGLVADKTQPSRDTDAFSKIGKVGMGDLDISDDGNKLWFVNLFNKKLYSIDITQYNQNGTTKPTASNVDSVAIPATCTGGEYRPWALKVYNGKVYVGGVCDAQSSNNKSNLRASVYEFDGTTFTPIFDFPLTYPKGYPAAASPTITGWFPWTDTFATLLDGTLLRHPVPMFVDIEFDIDGSMVLGFGDRTGWQGGDANYRPDNSSTTLYETNSQAGDILRAFYANGTFVLENNAKAGPSSGYGVNNKQGPGFGEFYNDDWVQENGTTIYHAEEAIGSLALKPGSGQVVVTAIDPQDKHPYAGGVRYMANDSGKVMGFYTVYITRGPDVGGTGEPAPIAGSFAKATGLGDIELSCDNLEILEIGNRTWLDTNKDGIQDACEKGLKDVSVTLYKGNTKIATTKTDANGEYYFSRKSKLTTGTWSATGADTTLLPNTAYRLVFGTSGQITNSNDTLKLAGLGKFLLTVKDATTGTGNDHNDSDAAKASVTGEGGSFPVITFTTGTIATTDHTLDAGFYCVEPYNYKATVTQATCTGITANSDAKIELTDVKCADKYAFSKNSGGKFTGVAYASATALTGTTITLNNLANPATAAGDTFYVRLYNGLCCYKDTTIILPFKDCSCIKPVVTATPKNQVICQGGTIASYTAVTLPSAGITYRWYGPLTDTTGTLGTAISGQTNATFTPAGGFTGRRYYAVIATGVAAICSDTAFVSLTINARPVANATAKQQTICVGDLPAAFVATPSTGVSYRWYGALSDTTGSLGTAIGGATSASFTPSGSAITTVGTKYYAVIVTNNQTSCTDTAFVRLVVNKKPTAGADSTGTNAICNTVGTINLPDAAAGESWIQLGTTPSVATIGAQTGAVTGLTSIGVYQFILRNPQTGCADTVAVEVKNCQKGSIGDYVWKDLNDNGVQDSGEPGVRGVIVQLLNSTTNAVLATDTTDVSGLYGFNGLESGSYKVKIVLSSLPDSCVISSKQNQGGDDAKDSDFSPTTGESQVVVINTLGTGLQKDNPTIDAGLFTPKGSIGDYVWKDLNDNGVQDSGEPGVKGVIVQLLNATTSAVLSTDTTDAGGLYSFPNLLSGSYQVKIVVTSLPDSCLISSKQNLGGDDTKDSDFSPTTGLSQVVTIDAKGTGIVKDNPTIDAGLFTPKGSIGDYVWKDLNDNGIQDSGEPGVKGVIVQLLNATTSAVLSTDTTDASGLYSFPNLLSGSYQVKIVVTSLPDSCTISSKQNLGGDDTKDSDFSPTTGLSQVVTITATGTGLAKDNPTIDAGLFTPKGSIGDYVWKDQNDNGVQDAAEPPVAGVIVQLLQGTTVLATDTTDANGLYLFPNLLSGTYQVKILTGSLPAGCVISSKKDQGGDDTKDSDFDPTTGLSQLVTINAFGTGISKDNPTVDGALFSPKGSIGDYVWKDLNDNGVQDSGEPGVAGVIVQLLNSTTSAVLATDTTNAQGLYLFSDLSSGSYQVKIVVTSLPDSCTISTKQNLGGDDTKDSDFSPTTGLSQVVVIDALGTGTAKDNMTIDAALVVPCITTSFTLTGAPVCSADVQTYSLTFTVTGKNGAIKVDKGVLSGNNPYTVTGIPSGASVRIVDTLSAICVQDTIITGPNCNCNPPVPILLAPSLTVCKGDTFPTLKATVVGLATVEWFSQQTGGTVLATGLNYKPSGVVTANAIFYAQARSTDPTCPTAVSTSRVPATINAQDCEIDLALKKLIDKKVVQIGDTLTYTIKVWNESVNNASGVSVTDSIASTVQFIAGSFMPSRGTASISGSVITWNIGNIAANGDTVTLTYRIKAIQEGIHYNTAQICAANEGDVDSTPCNNNEEEDDIDRQCFTVPIKLCPTEQIEVSIPAKYTNVQWFKDGGTTPVATGNAVLLKDVGSYTFTATNNTCPAEGCCPVIIVPGENCCPVDLCIPFTIKQTKKAGKKL